MISKIISDRYELLEIIGQGGMADVYLAKDIILNRTIAIKVLRSGLAKDPIYVTRFQREASAAATLTHKNIVEIYDVGEDNDKYYIVMEYVQGDTLKELIHKRGALHVAEAVDIMKQVVGGATKAHQFGIIHRDLKPQNILVTNSGVAKIADFGIASMQSLAQVTQTDVIMGSLHYLAPELARGEKATVQSDVYALGIVFYELLQGEVPFNGESPVNIAIKHMQSEIPSLREFNPTIPQSVENIVIKATAKNLKERYNNAAEMLVDIETCLSRLDEEKLVFKFNQNTDPTIILDPRSAFKEIDNNDDDKKEANNKKGLLNKIKALSTTSKVLIGIISVLLMSLIVYFAFFNSDTKNSMMPDLEGMTIEEAEVALKEFEVTIAPDPKEQLSDEYEAGKIISSNPKVGKTIKKGDQITVVISKGKYIVLEDYTGMTYEKAKKQLNELGFEVIKKEIESEETYGIVIEQSQTKGDKIDPTSKNLEITLTVSKGISITVPNVVGINIDKAKAELEGLGFVVKTEVLTSPTSAAEINAIVVNNVVKQSLVAFEKVNQKGMTITISYYDRKPEIPTEEIPTGSTN